MTKTGSESLQPRKSLTVEDRLKLIDYKEINLYVPSEFAISFVNFIKMVNGGEGESHVTPPLHYMMLDKITGRGKRILNMCSRGMAKTTLLGEYLILYLAVFGEIPGFGSVELGMYVSDSMENGVKNMRKNLEYRYQNSTFLKTYITNIRFTDVRWEFTNIEGKVLIFRGFGVLSGVRGGKELGRRYQIAILDDLMSDISARSETVTKDIHDIVYKAINHALDPDKKKIIWSGTPFNARDPFYKAANSKSWDVNIFPICSKFPCTREEFDGAWEDRFSYDMVQEEYDLAVDSSDPSSFFQELMLQITSEEERSIQDKDIKWYFRQEFLKRKHDLNFYITTDLATTTNNSSDYTVICVWAYDKDGHWYLVDGIMMKTETDKSIEQLFKYAEEYKPLNVGIEVSGQQGGFIPWIREKMIEKDIFFRIEEVRPTKSKRERFVPIEPWFKLGLMHFPEEMRDSLLLTEAINELSLITFDKIKSNNDDFIDTLTQLQYLKAIKSGEPVVGGDVMTINTKDPYYGHLDEHDEDADTSGFEDYTL